MNFGWRTNGSRRALLPAKCGRFNALLVLKQWPIRFKILTSDNQFFRHFNYILAPGIEVYEATSKSGLYSDFFFINL